MRKIKIPWGDGTSNLQEIEQTYVHVASELIDILDGARKDDQPSKGTFSFAKNIVFRDVLADADNSTRSVPATPFSWMVTITPSEKVTSQITAWSLPVHESIS